MIAPPYTVVFNEEAREFFVSRRVDNRIKRIILKKIDLLAQDPYLGPPLHGSLHGRRKLPVSYYRVIYRIEEVRMLVHIVDVGLRRDIYD